MTMWVCFSFPVEWWYLLPILALTWAPRTWTPGELVTAANMNLHMRDHLNALRATQATTVTGAQNNFAIDGPFVYLLCSNTTRVTFNGLLAPGGNVDGARIVVEALSEEVVFDHEASGSTSSNRILTPDSELARIRASSPTSRAMLLYDGTALRWRLSLITTVIMPEARVTEHFIGANIVNDQIGQHGWSLATSGSGSLGSGGSALHDRHRILITGTTINSVVTMHLRSWNGDWQEFAAFVRPRISTAAVRIHVGLVEVGNVTNNNEDHDGAFFSFDPAQSANWRTVTREAATKTANNSSVAVAVDKWYLLEMKKKGLDIEFLINGVLAATHTTNLPDATAIDWTSKFGITNIAAADKQVDAGYFSIVRKLKQRFT